MSDDVAEKEKIAGEKTDLDREEMDDDVQI